MRYVDRLYSARDQVPCCGRYCQCLGVTPLLGLVQTRDMKTRTINDMLHSRTSTELAPSCGGTPADSRVQIHLAPQPRRLANVFCACDAKLTLTPC